MQENPYSDDFCSIIGFGGVTCGGKSTIAHKLSSHLRSHFPENLEILILNQDDFYLPEEKCQRLENLKTWNFDDKSAIDFERMRNLMREKIEDFSQKRSKDAKLLIIVEGNMIFEDEKLLNSFRHVYFFKGEYENVKSIRDRRTYIPPDVPGYFDTIAWPAYLKHEENFLNSDNLRQLDRDFSVFKILDAKDLSRNFEEISRDVKTEFLRPKEWLKICNQDVEMSLEEAQNFVGDEKYGAVVNFVGTTRSTFQGKVVTHLEYECYESMAYKVMSKICKLARQKWPRVGRMVIFHRKGNVPSAKISIIVAVSAKHRKEAFACCDFLVDEVKSKVPIWKKEIYADGTSSWK